MTPTRFPTSARPRSVKASDVEQVLHAALLLAAGGGVGLLGRWGRAHAVTLAPDHLDVYDRERRIRSMERGALACYGAALVLVIAALLAVI